MKTFSDILGVYNSPSELSDDLGVKYVTARKMIERQSVAPRHWVKLIPALNARGVKVAMIDLQKMRPDLYPHLAGEAA